MRIPLHALAAVFALTPMSAATERLVSQPQSRLWVEGTSSLKSFRCSVPDFTLEVSADRSGAVAAVLAGQKAVHTVVLTVPAEKIECGNATMNEHMRRALKVTESSTIRFTLDGYNVASADSGVAGTIRGELALGGAEKPIEVAATGTNAGDDALRVTGSAEVALSAFDLRAPKLMFGRIKVGDKVRVKFDLTLKK